MNFKTHIQYSFFFPIWKICHSNRDNGLIQSDGGDSEKSWDNIFHSYTTFWYSGGGGGWDVCFISSVTFSGVISLKRSQSFTTRRLPLDDQFHSALYSGNFLLCLKIPPQKKVFFLFCFFFPPFIFIYCDEENCRPIRDIHHVRLQWTHSRWDRSIQKI